MNTLFSCRGATCGSSSCQMCYRNSVLGIWFSNSGFVYIFLLLSIYLCSLFACLSPASYTLSDSFGLKRQLQSDLSCVIFDIVSDLVSVSLSSGLDAVFFYDAPCITPDPIHLTVCSLLLSLLLYSERFFVKLNKSGLPKSPEKTERQCTLFVVSRGHDFVYTMIGSN